VPEKWDCPDTPVYRVERLNEEIPVPHPRWIIQGTKERTLCECTEMQNIIFYHLIDVVVQTKAQIRRTRIWRHENNFSWWMSEWEGDDKALMADVFDGIEDRFPGLVRE
jgi:hypothetical protein